MPINSLLREHMQTRTTNYNRKKFGAEVLIPLTDLPQHSLMIVSGL